MPSEKCSLCGLEEVVYFFPTEEEGVCEGCVEDPEVGQCQWCKQFDWVENLFFGSDHVLYCGDDIDDAEEEYQEYLKEQEGDDESDA